MREKYVQESDLRIWVKNIFRNSVLDFGLLDRCQDKALDGIWPVGHACAVLCWGTAAGGGCPSTALHRHDQLPKYHPVPWLRWPNVSWHQVFRLPEGRASIMPAIWSSESIMNLSWTYRESIVNLSWTYREPNYRASIYRESIPNLSWTYWESIVNLSQMPAIWSELNSWKSWNLVWNGSIWLGMSSY